MNQIYNPIIPFNGPIPGGMFPGRIIRIQGVAPPTSHKFAVNLLCGALGDIALHVSPHFSSGHIIRNSVQHRSWGHEEKHGGIPIHRGQPFSMIILCEPHQYKIAFNSHHFSEFNHRLALNSVTHVGIDGEVLVNEIAFEGSGAIAGGFVPTAPTVPYTGAHYPGGASHVPVGGSAYPPMGTPAYPAAHHQGQAPYPGHAAHAPYPTQHGHVPTHHGHVPTHGHTAHSAYPTQPGYPSHLSPHSAPSSGYPHSPTGHKKSGLLDKAGMAVAGVLGGSALMGGHNKYNKLGVLGGGGLGATLAGAAMTGHLNPKKAMKQQKKAHKKALKYGLPLAAAGVGAYGLHKVMHKHGHHRHSSSSSSSSSSSD